MSTRKEREKEEENERRAEEKIAKKAELVAKRAARDAEKAVKLATRVDEVVEHLNGRRGAHRHHLCVLEHLQVEKKK